VKLLKRRHPEFIKISSEAGPRGHSYFLFAQIKKVVYPLYNNNKSMEGFMAVKKATKKAVKKVAKKPAAKKVAKKATKKVAKKATKKVAKKATKKAAKKA